MKRPAPKTTIQLTLIPLMSVLTGLMAQLYFYIGPIPYTMQNFAVILTGLLLKPKFAFLAQLFYLFLIALGLPLAAGFKGGFTVLLGPTAGYLWSFPLVAYLVSRIVRPISNSSGVIKLWIICNAISIITHIIGVLWLAYWVTLYDGVVLSWIMLVSSMLYLPKNFTIIILSTGMFIFIPQDFLMDHLLAVILYKKLSRIMEKLV